MIAVGTGVFLATIDGSIVNIALPTLVRELATDLAAVQWVVLAYLLTLTTLILGVGRLADMKGKKPIYITGFIVFTVGSVLCGLAPNVYFLIAFRVLQALGGTMLMALGMGILTEAFPPAERGRALGMAGSMVSIGIIIGPTLGGLILGVLSWHWIFFVNLPVGIAGTLLAVRYIPSVRPVGGQRFDVWGALTLFAGLFSLLLGLTIGQEAGLTAPLVLVLFAVSIVFLALFVLIESRVRQPMIDLGLFKNDLFSAGLATGLMTFVASSGVMFLMPFYLEGLRGYDTRQIGLMLAGVPIVMGLIAPLSGSLSDRFGTRPMSVIGLVFLLIAYLAVRTLDLNTSALGYVLRFTPFALGMGFFQSPNNSAIMGTAPRDRLGVVSSMIALTRSLGQTVGIALLGTLWAGRVFFHAGAVYPDGATSAPALAQIAGLHDILIGVMAMIAFALGLSVYGLMRERRTRVALQVTPTPD
jgi:EmrB/QacA subfamily drug resistance transporter